MLASQLPDQLRSIFVYICDICTYHSVALTCRNWNTAVSFPQVTEKIYENFIASDRKNCKCLPAHTIEYSNPPNIGSSFTLKRAIQILSTSLIVTKENKELACTSPIHSISKQKRKCANIHQALSVARVGDIIIFPNTEDISESITISKNVQIIGRSLTFSSPINFQAPPPKEKQYHLPFLNEKRFDFVTFTTTVNVTQTQVSFYSVVFKKGSTLKVGPGAKVSLDACSDISCIIEIDDKFKYLHITDKSKLSDPKVLSTDNIIKILKRFKTLLENKEAAKAEQDLVPTLCACISTLAVVTEPKDKVNFKLVKENNFFGMLKSTVKVYLDNLVIMKEVILAFILLKTKVTKSIDIIPEIVSIMNAHSNQPRLHVQIAECLNHLLLERVKFRPYFDKSLVQAIYKSILHTAQDQESVAKLLELLWNCAHFLMPLRSHIIENLPPVVKVLDYHKKNDLVCSDLMGLIWNLPAQWPPQVTQAILPYLPGAIQMGVTSNNMLTVIGALLVLLINSSKKDIDSLLASRTLETLLDVKTYDKQIEQRLWKAIAWLAAKKSARNQLLFIINNRENTSVSDFEVARVLRTLSVHVFDHHIIPPLLTMVQTTNEEECFFMAMDAYSHLHNGMTFPMGRKEKTVFPDNEEVKKIGQIIRKRAESQFPNSKKIKNWLNWSTRNLNDKPVSQVDFGMDTNRSKGMYISEDGVRVRQNFISSWATAVSRYAVKSGKWYFELLLENLGTFQVGLVTSLFVSQPELALGVGDDKNGWSYDPIENAKWHEDNNGSLNQKYGNARPCVGGIVQCFIDADSRSLTFGYDGASQGAAFEEELTTDKGLFVAVSGNLEFECLFNFGQKPFSYDHPGYLPLADCLKEKQHLWTN